MQFCRKSAGSVLALGPVLIFLLVTGGCGDETSGSAERQAGLSATPAANTATTADAAGEEPFYLQSASTEEAKPGVKRVTVGSMGGSLRLDDRTGAIYSIEFRGGDAYLQGAALLRGTNRGWYERDQITTASAMRNPGIGASLGKHMVVVTPKADAIWIDDTTRVALSEGNIALFEGAGDELKQVGSVSIDSYLGPAPLEDAGQRRALVQGRLTELLKKSAMISSVWSN